MAGLSPGAAAIHLGRMLPPASCNLPGRLTRKLIAGLSPGTPSLFGFAPGGVCHAAPVTSCAVGSYPTLSPLPRHSLRPVQYPFSGRKTASRFSWNCSEPGATKDGAVSFLWHFPWGRPRRTLSGTVFPWSPDFPHMPPFGSMTCAAARPAGDPYKCILSEKRK